MKTPFVSQPGWLGSVAAVLLWPGAMSAQQLSFDLRPHADERTPLANPHKGWYHHFPDNHPDKYQIARDADLLQFPGMDHLYIRLAWSYLEPKEGQFDWPVIERIIDKWTAHGLGIAFRISCRETSTDRIEQQYATPRWVAEAGAKGGHYRMGQATGPDGPWEPVYDDPVFLAKLDRFLAAFAARYDGQPWLRYVDIGSIGDWGEGHSWAGSHRECGFAARMRHIDLHLAHFHRTQLIVSDDFVYALGNLPERQALHQHVLKNGISYRDDSILLECVSLPPHLQPGSESVIEFVWQNRGVAPAYHPYQLRLRWDVPETVEQDFDAGNRRWLPEAREPFVERYCLKLPATMKTGTYTLKFKLHSHDAARDVLVALRPELRDAAGFYRIGNVEVRK